MTSLARVLLVASSPRVASDLEATLTSAGYTPITVREFSAAKAVLETRPDFLITEHKLGAFNGLHLAILAADQGTPTIVIGESDPVLQAEATRQKAAVLTTPVDSERLLILMAEFLTAARDARRSPRKRIRELDAFVNSAHARLLDVSYEGMRIEAAESQPGALPPNFTVRVPRFNFSCRVQRVWAAPSSGGSSLWCGAELSASDAETMVAWRTLVDSLPGLKKGLPPRH